jgi:hypothetical protein
MPLSDHERQVWDEIEQDFLVEELTRDLVGRSGPPQLGRRSRLLARIFSGPIGITLTGLALWIGGVLGVALGVVGYLAVVVAIGVNQRAIRNVFRSLAGREVWQTLGPNDRRR